MKHKLLRFSGYGLFWSWNLIFTLLVLFLLFPKMIIPIISGTHSGAIFLDQGLFALLLFIVPLLTIILGLTKNFRKNPTRLLKLFYGLELPLFFLIIARLTVFRELHPGTLQVLILSIIAISAYGVYLFSYAEQKRSGLVAMVLQLVISCSLIVALYIALFLLFFVFPVGKEFLEELISFSWVIELVKHPIALLASVFVIYTLSLLLGLPVAVITLYGIAFIRQSKLISKQLGKLSVTLIIFITIVFNGLLFYHLNQQQQLEAFVLLDAPIKNDEQRKALLDQQHTIRHGLLNAYLASYRYLSTTQSSKLIQRMYVNSFGLERHGSARLLQNWFNALASPFLYQGRNWSLDAQKAEQLYQSFFDSPIEKAESAAINQALKSNWLRDGMQAGLINSDQQKVLISKQAISVMERQHSAIVTLSETYQNQTFEQQEIYYYFTLPEEAVITGLWLSDDADNLKKYAYTIAPRGAAAKLYRQERDRRVDPALLEQVGPKQYRLRVFPVPAKSRQSKAFKVVSKPLHMQLEYCIPLMTDRQWILPKLLEKRNVFWQKNTPLMVNNFAYSRPDNGEQGRWLPAMIPAKSAQPLSNTSSQIPINEQQWLEVKIDDRQTLTDTESILTETQSLAVLIDTSYSMSKIKSSLDNVLRRLQQLDKKSSLQIDFFSIADTVRPVKDIDAWLKSEPLLFGYNTTLKQLNQWQQSVPDGKKYNAIIMLTDMGNYESKEIKSISINKEAPLWLLHLGDAPAYAYADQLLDYIYQSGGGVAQDLDNILLKIFWKQQRSAQQLSEISDHYLWHYRIIEPPEVVSPESDELASVIAHQWLSADFNRHNAAQSTLLDGLHSLAKKHSLVSPFSSMIVLVNERQEKELEQLSKAADRFNREIETGKKIIVKGNDLFSVSSVPEPEEWALLIVVLILLSAAMVKKRTAQQSVNQWA